ncbi:MAG: BON domain-containing protein [Nitrosomonas sp.]|nr:BON domain-containing protein [Nitrosomonas sp.]
MLNRYKLFSLVILIMSALALTGCGNWAESTHESWVTPPPGVVYDDSTIYARITYALHSDPDLQGIDVDIKVNDGEVLLSGTVNNKNQITRLAMHTWIVDGVKNLDNQVTLK